MQVLVNVALRLADLHEAGWVHGDLKPGNVLWLPRKQRWTLIDFALATHEGVETPVIFTPSYAAPEIVKVSSLLTSKQLYFRLNCGLCHIRALFVGGFSFPGIFEVVSFNLPHACVQTPT